MLELPGELRDVGVHAREGLNLIGNLGALVGNHHEIGGHAALRGDVPHDEKETENGNNGEDTGIFLHGCSLFVNSVRIMGSGSRPGRPGSLLAPATESIFVWVSIAVAARAAAASARAWARTIR